MRKGWRRGRIRSRLSGPQEERPYVGPQQKVEEERVDQNTGSALEPVSRDQQTYQIGDGVGGKNSDGQIPRPSLTSPQTDRGSAGGKSNQKQERTGNSRVGREGCVRCAVESPYRVQKCARNNE